MNRNNYFAKNKKNRQKRTKGGPLLLALILCLRLAFIIHPVRAATLDAAGAAHLKTIFATLLQNQSTLAAGQGAKFSSEGAILVEPADGYYAVTLPRLTIVNADGTRLELGMIAINATPDTVAGRWKMTVALPMPLTWFDTRGGKQFVAEIGRQSFAGIWQENLNAFTKFTADYRNIKITAANDQFKATVNTFVAAEDLKSTAGSRWSGPLQIDMDGVSIANQNGDNFAVGHAGLLSHLDGYEFTAGGMTGKLLRLAGFFAGGNMSPDTLAQTQMLQMLGNMAGTLADSMGVKGTVRDVRITRRAPDGLGLEKISLPAGDASVDLTGLRGSAVNGKLSVHYEGLNAAPPPAVTTPDHLALEAAADNVPYKNLAAIGSDWLQAMAQGPNMAAIAKLRALISLPAALEQAGAHVTVKTLDLGNSLYQTRATGTAASNAQAALGVTGKARVEITGLENITNAVKSQLVDPHTPPEQKPVLQKLAQTLTMVQMVGQQTAGGAARSYNLELNAQGQTLLNGTDINTLIPPPATPTLQ